MELHNLVKERLGDGARHIWMTERYEVRKLGEPINHSQHHRLATHPRKNFHKIHRDVAPDVGRHRQRLKQSYRVKVLGLVSLTNAAPLDEVAHALMELAVEGPTDTMQRLL
uniref:Uncharacterized protein n=1 Tax=Arundo donax TaxID=35708 RepID=A0A0A8YRB7_ARUDO